MQRVLLSLRIHNTYSYSYSKGLNVGIKWLNSFMGNKQIVVVDSRLSCFSCSFVCTSFFLHFLSPRTKTKNHANLEESDTTHTPGRVASVARVGVLSC